MSTSMRRIAFLLGVLGLLVLLAGVWRPATVVAQAPKAEFKLKLMGINRTLDPWKLYQEWAQTVEKRTNGRVQFELTSLPELSLGGAETAPRRLKLSRAIRQGEGSCSLPSRRSATRSASFLILNRATPGLAAGQPLRNFDIFDVALNAV